MLIVGENAMVFVPNGYGFSVLIGTVKSELTQGWIVDPAREVLNTNNGDCWVELANGSPKLRKACTYGPLMKDGARIPLGCMSLVWQGELPE